jgi:hypothetical protein
MELKKAKQYVCEMLDICSQLEDPTLLESCSGIYNDVKVAKTTECVVASARELMVFVGEAPWEDFEMTELLDEIESIFNQLLEENEEL